MIETVANLHVHSTHSDGSLSIPAIAAEAQRAGIQVVGISDHNTLKGLRLGENGWYDDVLVIVGEEINREKNHYLAWGITTEVPPHTEAPQVCIDQVKAQGGIGFIAHPFEKGSPLVGKGKCFPWTDFRVDGFTGVSIWNYTSQFRDGAGNLFRALGSAYFNPHAYITGPDPEVIAFWDQRTRTRPVVAIGCSDAHAAAIRYGPLERVIFPYQFLFRCVNTHLLLEDDFCGDMKRDTALVLKALQKGHCFVAFDYYLNSRGFRLETENSLMGDEAALQSGLKLKAYLPAAGKIRLIHNGRPIKEEIADRLTFILNRPGVYRLEAFLRVNRRWFPWIFSNPLYVS